MLSAGMQLREKKVFKLIMKLIEGDATLMTEGIYIVVSISNWVLFLGAGTMEGIIFCYAEVYAKERA